MEGCGRGRLPLGMPESVALSLKVSVSTFVGPGCPVGAASVLLPWSGTGFFIYSLLWMFAIECLSTCRSLQPVV